MGLKLTYAKFDAMLENISDKPPQPVLVQGKGNKRPTRVVPIARENDAEDSCTGCIAHGTQLSREFGDSAHFNTTYDCYDLPDCGKARYVRATPENKLRYIEWRLENDK